MKKIIVFTDFSERAAHAGEYAFQLSRELQANIILYHAYLNPASQPYAAQVAWPMENAGALGITSRKELALAASKLSKTSSLSSATGFTPKIETRCDEGEIADHIDELLSDRDIVLFVMANHRKGFSSLITGNHMKKLLEQSKVPVLVVPQVAAFKGIHKIAFATDLQLQDIEALHSLCSLARHREASIMLAHVSSESEQEQGKEKRDQVQQFLCAVSSKINYPHIYYRHVQDAQVSSGLKWVSEHVSFDLLVMVHHQKNFLQRLFSSSNTHEVANDMSIPLLVYPYPAEHYPVF
jgi:nucleotide-binding universal stress UspA family protein